MIVYFLIVLAGSLIAGRLILGELRKERREYIPIPSLEKGMIPTDNAKYSTTDQLAILAEHTDTELLERVRKSEELLAEKNAELVKLTQILEAERRHKNEFEKIKSLLQWQIFETRQMNKQIKQELDSLTIQRKQFEDEAYQLRTELNYKEQVLTKHENKISELNNRLRNFLSVDASGSDSHQTKTTDPAISSFDDLDWRTKLSE